MAARSKAWVCDRSLAGISGSNLVEDMDICLLWVLCVVRWRSLCRADHSSRGVPPTVVCLSVIMNPWLTRCCYAMGVGGGRKIPDRCSWNSIVKWSVTYETFTFMWLVTLMLARRCRKVDNAPSSHREAELVPRVDLIIVTIFIFFVSHRSLTAEESWKQATIYPHAACLYSPTQ